MNLCSPGSPLQISAYIRPGERRNDDIALFQLEQLLDSESIIIIRTLLDEHMLERVNLIIIRIEHQPRAIGWVLLDEDSAVIDYGVVRRTNKSYEVMGFVDRFYREGRFIAHATRRLDSIHAFAAEQELTLSGYALKANPRCHDPINGNAFGTLPFTCPKETESAYVDLLRAGPHLSSRVLIYPVFSDELSTAAQQALYRHNFTDQLPG